MKAIVQTDPDVPRSLEWREVDTPELRPGEVLVKVAAAGVNRGDLAQTRGHYPPPRGASEVLGLEAAGTIVDAGDTEREVGEEVGCLLAGGGYGEYVAVPVGQLTPVPEGYDLVKTAAVVELTCTVWSNIVMTAGLRAGQRILIHGGAGGIGTIAIQIAKALGAEVAVTAGSAEKLETCRELGADILINYREEDFVEKLRDSCDVILDIMGASYLDRNMRCLALDGHLVVIGVQGGVKAELNLGRMLPRRQSITAQTIRARNLDDKAAIVADTVKNVWPMLADARVVPHIHDVIPVTEAARAHEMLDSGEVTGKLVLQMP
ncbi:NAD(P)H-quinone oxidoreductase [Corynebacterium guangdongense]|uniref:PIG3 family NAD(P)H quinone oxidoreductase n=1 Tax=Corynebacterium guangdongense TaxID=1783348 RepID=A0ABU2A0N8_9CORY|nr:NAD(P)H-quinone oxidoreductase [Corynebacterium guangdongense]MDR7330750.1 putative PIG3 family NAD(P)H quinone oxidoreductase [Corynebacterium guangdongense]WJZ16765.1 Quinone oxidoreductase 1 [Corynebacterium guangdongense]